ncbi:hypothetical protein WJX72_001955 [[Myrmecia] bisecta]|uniref:Cilia- and flagella-associated protein 43 n=1 Tax=[Myrmecia] bisecta TaxID=41462 RepID=A0AAW1P926_9CHLO
MPGGSTVTTVGIGAAHYVGDQHMLYGTSHSFIVSSCSLGTQVQEREVLLSHCWLAGGSLLLGTSKGRILTVAGAAPSTPLLRTWGKQPALKAEARCDLSSQLNRHGAVMALGLIDAHLVAFFTDAARGSGGASGDVRVVDLALPAEESASARTRFASAGGCHDGSICGLCVSDGLLVSGGADGTVRAWDISRSKDSNTEAVQLQSIWRLSTPVIKARPIPDSQLVAVATQDGAVYILDTQQSHLPGLTTSSSTANKSLRRYRITAEDVQRGQKDIVYMRSEKDVTSDIQKPVCSLVLSPTEDDLAVASADGCIAIYSLPELKLQSYSALHSGVAGGASDVAFLSDSTVASSGFDGLIQLVRMPRPDDAFRDDPPKLLWPPAKQLPQETVIAAPVRPQEGATGSSALPGPGRPSAVPAARSSTQQATAARLAQLRQRLRRVARQNDAADESEQLTEAELLINHSLRARLEAAGEKHIQQVRAELLHHRLADQLATERVRALVWDSAEVPAARIQALADRCVAAGLSCLDAPVARPPILACHKLEAVESYAELRESAQQWRRFDQVKFLRDMEQLEWQERPAWERGKLSGLSKEAEVETPAESIADEDENVDPEMPAAPLATSPTDASALLSSTMAASAFAAGTQRLPEAAEEQADTTDRGGTGVLYGWAEVHTPLRKTMQIILLQREARLCRQRFNAEFGALQEQKRKVLVQVDARVGRILDIHAELADTPGTPGEADAQKEAKPPDMIRLEDDEKPSAVLEVQDREVLAPKVLTAAEQASALEDERLTEAARLRGEQDEAARRALSDMMGGKLARPLRQDAAQAPEREPWMSVPAHLLTLGQQDAMRAFEARLQDYYEVQERRRRQLQADIKGLRIEIEELCVAFDLQLLGLLGAKMRSTACLALLELQAVRLAGALQHDLDTSAQLAQLGQQLAQVQQQQAARKPLLAELRKAADRAMAHEEELGHQYKLVERAFRKEYSNRSDFAALLAVLHERGHAATFHVDFRVKSVEELLGIAGTAAAPLRASPSEVDSQGSSPSRQGTAAPARPHSTLKAVSKTVALLAKFTRRDNPPGAEAGPQLEYQFLPLSLAGLLPSHAEGSVFQPSPMHHSAAHTNSGTRGPGLQHQLSRLPSSAAEASSSASSAATLEARRSAGAEASTSASLWTFENKPDNVGADVWLRLIELRNLRFSLESDLQATSVVAEVLTEQLQDLEDKEKEQTSTTKRLHQEIASLHSDAAREAYNLDVFLFLKQGQVEVLSANLVPDYSDAVLLDRAAIEELNGIIVSEAGANTGIVRQLQRQRRQMALAQWQNKAADLIMAHRQEDIKEIQLTHLTRDMPLKAGLGPGQARAGDSRIVETPRGKQQEARSEALLAAARKLHGGKIGAVSDRYLHITKEVVRHERQNQEVAQRTQAAAQMLYETRRVQQATNARRGERHTSQQECMQIITASSELSLIAKAQQEELEYFRIEAQRLQRRSYPTFAVPHVIAPDLSYDHHRV